MNQSGEGKKRTEVEMEYGISLHVQPDTNADHATWQVMSMYGLLKEKPHPSAQEVEDQFDGNLCR